MKMGLTKICYHFFTNLANPTRLAAIEQLMQKPMSVNELATALGQEQSMISHNLKPLLRMQPNPCQTTRQKTHLHGQPRNPEPHLCSNRKSRTKILPHRRKMPKRRNLNMIKRKIVNINEKLCNGCGNCIPKCAEGALQIVNGKAKMIKETYCDGLGACLGQCPQGAITITEREAEPFNETETHEHLKNKANLDTAPTKPPQKPQWPIKLNLVPLKAPFFENANLLLAADCAPVALKNFHDLMAGKRVIIGCPKFNDASAYAEKLTEIFKQNNDCICNRCPYGSALLHRFKVGSK